VIFALFVLLFSVAGVEGQARYEPATRKLAPEPSERRHRDDLREERLHHRRRLKLRRTARNLPERLDEKTPVPSCLPERNPTPSNSNGASSIF